MDGQTVNRKTEENSKKTNTLRFELNIVVTQVYKLKHELIKGVGSHNTNENKQNNNKQRNKERNKQKIQSAKIVTDFYDDCTHKKSIFSPTPHLLAENRFIVTLSSSHQSHLIQIMRYLCLNR